MEVLLARRVGGPSTPLEYFHCPRPGARVKKQQLPAWFQAFCIGYGDPALPKHQNVDEVIVVVRGEYARDDIKRHDKAKYGDSHQELRRNACRGRSRRFVDGDAR